MTTTKARRTRQAAYQRAYIQRQRDAGLAEVRGIWAPPEAHAAIKVIALRALQNGEARAT